MEHLLPAAILHDVVNLPKNHPERSRASRMAAEKSRQILKEADYPEADIETILKIITEHSYSRGLKPSSIESAVLQDADRLDALGAIGVMRTVTTGSRLGCTYYNPIDAIPSGRPLDDKAFTVDHFFAKLFQLPELMNTEPGKAEAKRRVAFMQTFLTQLENEIGSAHTN